MIYCSLLKCSLTLFPFSTYMLVGYFIIFSQVFFPLKYAHSVITNKLSSVKFRTSSLTMMYIAFSDTLML